MRTAGDLTPDEFKEVVNELQQALYLDFDTGRNKFWNPDKTWEAAEVCDHLASVLNRFDLVPHSVIPVVLDTS